MATTYIQLAKQIKALQAQAEQVKKKEIAGVISSIKEAIALYALTPEELGFGAAKSTRRRPAAGQASAAKPGRGRKARSTRASVAYRDAAGNTWGGRGPRPVWLRNALSAGASLESFAVGGAAPAQQSEAVTNGSAQPTPAAARKAKVSKANKAAKAVKYRDEAGHTWSGFGPKPGWLKDALAAGKSLEDLSAG